jgi:hypothetical protein
MIASISISGRDPEHPTAWKISKKPAKTKGLELENVQISKWKINPLRCACNYVNAS